jgi:hypothetical protein
MTDSFPFAHGATLPASPGAPAANFDSEAWRLNIKTREGSQSGGSERVVKRTEARSCSFSEAALTFPG